MQFYASITDNPKAIHKMYELLEDKYGSIGPLNHVIFTPIAQSETTRKAVYDLVESYDINVVFDSGGYEVQVNNRNFDSLYEFLVNYYKNNFWAYRYVLPDNVPLSDDSKDTVERKVKETIAASTICFEHIPEYIQKRSIAVVQGHTKEQIFRCIENYSQLNGLNHIGFGSFGTNGKKNGVNVLTKDSVSNFKYAIKLAKKNNLTVHAFGIGGPTTIPILNEIGVDSFDSGSWKRSGGYGNVFFPFKSRMNATHRKSRTGNTLLSSNIDEVKYETNHYCPFCENIDDLRNRRWYRIIHNLIVMNEMVGRLDELSKEEIVENMNPRSTYRKILECL